MTYRMVLSLLASACIAMAGVAEQPTTVAPVSRIVFGSCIEQDHPAPIFKTMLKEKPELLLFTGDNIYADTEDMDVMQAKYRELARLPDFETLRQSCLTMATWDDHDYGVNDGGANYPQRVQSQRAFMDFWNVPQDSPRRKQPGVYDSIVIGDDGKRLQIIMLDTRYFRSPLKTGERRLGGSYHSDRDPTKTMLGEAQWQWLEQQLKQPAEVRLIVSSIQFAAAEMGQECWANLPLEQERMLQLFEKVQADGVVFISGDRHWSEISALKRAHSYPIFDVTCSSLNQLHPRGTPTENQYRINPSTFHRENYGVLAIDWSSDHPQLSFQICDIDGKVVIEQHLKRGVLIAQ